MFFYIQKGEKLKRELKPGSRFFRVIHIRLRVEHYKTVGSKIKTLNSLW